MIQNFIPWIGACAAVLTSLSYIPQVQCQVDDVGEFAPLKS